MIRLCVQVHGLNKISGNVETFQGSTPPEGVRQKQASTLKDTSDSKAGSELCALADALLLPVGQVRRGGLVGARQEGVLAARLQRLDDL